MTNAEVKRLLADIVDAYPKQQLTDGTVQIYCRMLVDLDAVEANRALEEWISEHPFFPTIADIRSRALPKGDPIPPEGHRWIVMDRTQDGELWQAECSDGWWYRFEGRVPVRDREARRSRA